MGCERHVRHTIFTVCLKRLLQPPSNVHSHQDYNYHLNYNYDENLTVYRPSLFQLNPIF